METIDDRNLAWKYQGNWHLEDNNSNLNLNSTTWIKDTKNATAEITFVGNCLGQFIQVFSRLISDFRRTDQYFRCYRT